MALTGDQTAILTARFGAGRFGASRFGFTPRNTDDGIYPADPDTRYKWREDSTLPTTTWTVVTEVE